MTGDHGVTMGAMAPDIWGDRALAEKLENRVDAAAGRYVGLSVGAVVGDAEATLGTGRTGPGGVVPGRHTSFQIGSVTKVFTSLLLADAAGRGEVALDQRLDTLIPETASHPDGRPVTLVDLATHTSGLPRLPPGLWREALRSRRDPYARLARDDVIAALQRAPRRPPGRRYRYSNYGAGVLGEALARACGRSYAELIGSRIATPLQMNRTTVSSRPDAVEVAQGHSRRGKPVPDWHLPGIEGAGAIRSTASDMLAFLRAHLRPERTPLEQAVATVLERRRRVRGALHIALGWHVLDQRGGSAWWWHNGGTGGFFSFVAFDPVVPAGVVVSANSARSVDRLGMALMGALTAGSPD